jgi:aminoglycoside 6'-N-acetyltransferase I
LLLEVNTSSTDRILPDSPLEARRFHPGARSSVKIRAYRDTDWSDWLRMSLALFPHHSAEDLTAGMREFRARSDSDVFVAERADGYLAGFVEVGARLYADGCDTSPVGYIEALYVDPDMRRRGFARALLSAAEEWARGRGYREMASDSQLDNQVSHAAHRRVGYEEVDRVVQFRKVLTDDVADRDRAT